MSEKKEPHPIPKAVLFDWDNTLVDTWPVIHQALTDTFVAMGQEPWTIEKTRAEVQHSMRDYFPTLFAERWEEAGEVYQRSYQARHLKELKKMPGADALLDWLADRSVFLAVVSNKKGHNLRKEISHLGWDGYFQRIVGSQDSPADKPAGEPVFMALEGTGIKPGDHVWFIGDSVVDLECAYNTGCFPVLYGAHRPEGIHDGIRERLHARDHTALHDIFKALTD